MHALSIRGSLLSLGRNVVGNLAGRLGGTLGLCGLLAGCATSPDPILSTGGMVPPNIERSLRCPRGTGIVFGRTGGVQSSAWCERVDPAGNPTGVKHGPFVEWYESLQKKNVGLYEEGLRQGPWHFYLPAGPLESEVIYDHGNVVPKPAAPTAPPAAAPPASAPPASAPPASAPPASAPPASAPPAARPPATAPAAAAP